MRCRLKHSTGGGLDSGSRFYLSYSGSAPSGANCATLATDIANAWSSHLAAMVNTNIALQEVDVLDIATSSGQSGQWTGSEAGTRSGTALPDQVAANVEFGIGRRYRGGKPRIYLPPGVEADLATQATWSSSFLSSMNTAFGAFMTAVTGSSVGSMGSLNHVNLSYFSGFTNHTNTSGRARAVPTYRSAAQHDNVTGYFAKAMLGSQRRRRTSTS